MVYPKGEGEQGAGPKGGGGPAEGGPGQGGPGRGGSGAGGFSPNKVGHLLTIQSVNIPPRTGRIFIDMVFDILDGQRVTKFFLGRERENFIDIWKERVGRRGLGGPTFGRRRGRGGGEVQIGWSLTPKNGKEKEKVTKEKKEKERKHRKHWKT